MSHEISVDAGKLLEAISIVVPAARGQKQKSRPYPISIRFDDWRSMLRIIESRHGARGHEVEASGSWPDKVQIDGRKLRELARKFKPEARVILSAKPNALVLTTGSFFISFDRLDPNGRGGIELANFPENKKHRGRIEVRPDPVEKRVELDHTWDFSARMPVPQHRKPKG